MASLKLKELEEWQPLWALSFASLLSVLEAISPKERFLPLRLWWTHAENHQSKNWLRKIWFKGYRYSQWRKVFLNLVRQARWRVFQALGTKDCERENCSSERAAYGRSGSRVTNILSRWRLYASQTKLNCLKNSCRCLKKCLCKPEGASQWRSDSETLYIL